MNQIEHTQIIWSNHLKILRVYMNQFIQTMKISLLNLFGQNPSVDF